MQIIVDVNMTNGDLANRVARVYGTQFVEWRNQENQPLRNEDRISAELLDYESLQSAAFVKIRQAMPDTSVSEAESLAKEALDKIRQHIATSGLTVTNLDTVTSWRIEEKLEGAAKFAGRKAFRQ